MLLRQLDDRRSSPPHRHAEGAEDGFGSKQAMPTTSPAPPKLRKAPIPDSLANLGAWSEMCQQQ
jgi:hypothetical protein